MKEPLVSSLPQEFVLVWSTREKEIGFVVPGHLSDGHSAANKAI